MTSVIGQILPLAIAVALSTVPIIAAILILLSDARPLVSIALLVGWACGMALILTAFTVGVALIPASSPARSSTTIGVTRIALGTALLVYSILKWRGRTRDATHTPRWMEALNRITPIGAFGFGAALALRPKNIVLSIAGAVVIGDASLPTGDAIAAIAIFTVIGVSTVAAPIIGYFSAPEKAKRPLNATRTMIISNGGTIMLVVALMVSALVIGSGISRL